MFKKKEKLNHLHFKNIFCQMGILGQIQFYFLFLQKYDGSHLEQYPSQSHNSHQHKPCNSGLSGICEKFGLVTAIIER